MNRHAAISVEQARSLRADAADVAACVVDALHMVSGPMNAVLLGAEVARMQAVAEQATQTTTAAGQVQEQAARVAELIDALRSFAHVVRTIDEGDCQLAEVIARLPWPYAGIAAGAECERLRPVALNAALVSFALQSILRNANARDAGEVSLRVTAIDGASMRVDAVRGDDFTLNVDATGPRLRKRLLDCLFAASGASLPTPLSVRLPLRVAAP